MKEWIAFWAFCAVFVVVDAYLASTGMDTVIYRYRTPAEQQLQQNIINKAAQRPPEECRP